MRANREQGEHGTENAGSCSGPNGEAHRLAHKLRDPKFYTARTRRAVNSLTVERGPKGGAA